MAALRVGVKHFAWQQIQIEPSAAWHQDVNSQARHYYDTIPTLLALLLLLHCSYCSYCYCYCYYCCCCCCYYYYPHDSTGPLHLPLYLTPQDPYIYHYTFGVEVGFRVRVRVGVR